MVEPEPLPSPSARRQQAGRRPDQRVTSRRWWGQGRRLAPRALVREYRDLRMKNARRAPGCEEVPGAPPPPEQCCGRLWMIVRNDPGLGGSPVRPSRACLPAPRAHRTEGDTLDDRLLSQESVLTFRWHAGSGSAAGHFAQIDALGHGGPGPPAVPGWASNPRPQRQPSPPARHRRVGVVWVAAAACHPHAPGTQDRPRPGSSCARRHRDPHVSVRYVPKTPIDPC